MKDKSSAIWLDLETGGIDPAQSSILSAAWGEAGNIKTRYAQPIPGTFLSDFSSQHIIPQLRNAPALDMGTEHGVIKSLIESMEAQPHSPIAGFNIRGFDFGFIQKRARGYGLEERFSKTLAGRQIIDPIHQVKGIISSNILEHARAGLFNEDLGVSSWSEATDKFSPLPFKQRPTEFNLLSSIEGYVKAGREKSQFKGWKLEDINKLIEMHSGTPTLSGGVAHEAAADLVMSKRVVEAAKSGELSAAFQKPEIAKAWMNITKSRGYHQFGGGKIVGPEDIIHFPGMSSLKTGIKSHWKMAGVGAAAVLAAAVISGRDDDYNTIEGLRHGNLAQSKRLELTEFGSGWQGASSLRRAERLYKSIIKSTLSQSGHKGKINWLSHLDEDTGEMVLAARNAKGERLMGVQRTFSRENVDLTSIEIDKSLQGGTGSLFYDYENRALKRLGLSGADVTSPVANPVTGRLQSKLYGSKPLSMFHRDMEEAYGTNPEEFQEMLMNKQMTKDQWSALGLAPTFKGKISNPSPSPIMSGKDDAHNTIEGLAHGGVAQRLRKLLTEFGSGWRGIINLSNKMDLGRFSKSSGAAGDIYKFQEIWQSNVTSLKALHGNNWWKTEAGKATHQFGKELIEAKEAGFTHVAAINTENIRAQSVKAGVSYGKMLKHTIEHERTHLGLRLQGAAVGKTLPVPAAFKAEMAKNAAYKNIAPEMLAEEYVANFAAVSKYPERAKIDSRVRSAILGASTEELARAEALSNGIAQKLKVQRKKNMIAFNQKKALGQTWQAGIDAGRRSKMG